LKGVDRTVARRLAAERLARGGLPATALETLVNVFSALGLGEEREALRGIVLSPSQPEEIRNCAVRSVIAGRDPELLRELSEQLAPEQAASLARSAWGELIAQAEASDAGAELVASVLKENCEETRSLILRDIEAARREAGARAAALYRKALGKPSLGPARKAMLDAIVEEADPGAVALIQRCFEAAPHDDFRRELQAGLMRLRTQVVSAVPVPRAGPAGYAMLGACDGQGAILIFACFTGSGRRLTLADVCVRLSEDVRDGFIIPRQTQEEIDQMVLEMSTGAHTRFVRTDLGKAAALVAEAVDRTRAMGRTIPEDVRPAIARLSAVAPEAPEPLPEPAEGTSIEEVRGLLARPELARSWFFDHGDLEAGGTGPAVEGPRWVAKAARKLDAPPVRARVAAMAVYMARWYAWDGDARAASVFRALSDEIQHAFADSLLVRAMLEKSQEMSGLKESPEEAGLPRVGDPEHRADLRARLFAEVRKPRGRDLALLDFTEVACDALERLSPLLPGHERLRTEDLISLSHTIALQFFESFRKVEASPEKIEARAARALSERAGLSSAASRELARGALLRLTSFVFDICETCEVGCLEKPDRDASGPFHAPQHPHPRLR
jgi:hypothetical protein